MKSWKLIIVLVAALLAIGCSASKNESGNKPEHNTDASDEKVSNVEKNKARLDAFVGAYNAVNEPDITGLNYFDPKDKDGDHYRVEYRLHAWRESAGAYGMCGNCSVDMTAYQYDEFRVYATGPAAEAELILKASIKMLHPSVTDQQIDAAVQQSKDRNDHNVGVEGIGIDPILLTINGDNAEIMVNGKYTA